MGRRRARTGDPERVKLSRSFSLTEFAKSQTASRHGIDNSIPTDKVDEFRWAAVNILQPVRDELGKALVITSGYRCQALNTRIGGSENSAHLHARAVDCECPGMSNPQLARIMHSILVERGIPWDQIITEFCRPGELESGWVHIAWQRYNGEQRRELLSTPNGVDYKVGLRP